MAKKPTKEGTSTLGEYWANQIHRQSKDYSSFHGSGDIVVDQYRIEKANASNAKLRGEDRYNILYSSTETIRPSLYAQTPKIEGKPRHRDRKNPTVRSAINLLETCVQYALEEIDIDEVMENVIEDYTLPGLGLAWVRYVPTFKDQTDAEGKPVKDEYGDPAKVIDFEALSADYIYWKDILFGPARVWKEVPWAAKRVYHSKKKATEAFGKEKADKLVYANADSTSLANDGNGQDAQAVIWEIWDKENKKVIWFSENFPGKIIRIEDDFLKLKNFWPFPRPLRAIRNTKKIVPRPFYAQYQAQAEELNSLTVRIRHLTSALQVRGVFDGSMDQLANLLSPTGGNKMIPVDNWQQFVQNGGMVGSVQWVPIKDIVQVLMELLKAREVVKAEIYEITGFSDIVRGSSKASETLGAQQIKTDWASARLKMMQKEVQRFVRELVRIMAEIISEHFTEETLALYSGFELPQPDPNYQQAVQAAMEAQQPPPPDPQQVAVQSFREVIRMLKTEKERCALIGIETDSTILPDEEKERKDRMDFLGAAGAYLQQAAPSIQQFPEMREILIGMLMFTVRTFRAARPLEQQFEEFQDRILNMPAQNPEGGGEDGAAKAQSATDVAQIKAEADKAAAMGEQQLRRYEIDAETNLDREKEQNRHNEKMAELQLREREVRVKELELGIKEQQADTADQVAQSNAAIAVADHQHKRELDDDNAARQDEQFEANREDEQARAAAEDKASGGGEIGS